MKKMKASYSQYKAMMALTKASLTSMLRSPSAVVFTIAFPLVFIIVFGFLSGNGISLDVAIESDSEPDALRMAQLDSIPGIRLHTQYSDAVIQEKLKRGELDASLSITHPKDKPIIFELQLSEASLQKAQAFKLMLQSKVNEMNLNLSGIHERKVMLQSSQISGRPYKTIDFILPGQLGFSLLGTGVFGTAFVFFNFRQTLVVKRFFVTPIKRPYILLSEALSRATFALAGSLLLLLIGYFAFGFTLSNGVFTLLQMLFLSLLGLLTFMGFGFIVSGLAKSESSIPPLANIITLPQFLLAGTFFPISAFPEWLQPLCKILPLTYLNNAYRKIAFDGYNLTDVSAEIGILLLWGVMVHAIAVKVFRWE